MGEKEGVAVNEQELQQALLARARQFPGQEKEVFDYYRKNPGSLVELRGPIFEQKVVDLIVSKAKIEDKKITRDELKKMVEEAEEDVNEDGDNGVTSTDASSRAVANPSRPTSWAPQGEGNQWVTSP
jgi:trigger factor